jgi:hypothetical protein
LKKTESDAADQRQLPSSRLPAGFNERSIDHSLQLGVRDADLNSASFDY